MKKKYSARMSFLTALVAMTAAILQVLEKIFVGLPFILLALAIMALIAMLVFIFAALNA